MPAKILDGKAIAAQIENELASYASRHPEGVERVRLLVSQDGRVRIESCTLELSPSTPQFTRLAERPVSRRNVMLFHKTTYRKIYDVAGATVSPGVFDHLLWNEENELTEFTRGNLVAELDGKLWTPPLDCGDNVDNRPVLLVRNWNPANATTGAPAAPGPWFAAGVIASKWN